MRRSNPTKRQKTGTRLGLALLGVSLLACELDDGPRRAPYPIVDPRGAFPELAELARSRDPEPAAADGVRGEEWLDSVCGGDPGGDRELLVGGSLAVNLPDPSWKAVVGPQGGRRILRVEQGEQTLAWVYFEEIRGSASVQRFRDFLSRIDRGLVEPLPSPVRFAKSPAPAREPVPAETTATVPAPSPEANPKAVPPTDLVDPLAAAGDTLKTMAAAVDEGIETAYLPRSGYESLSGSFTGWRWFGRCSNSPTLPLLRLARTMGTWRQNGRADAAYMIVGSATWGGDRGVYLAIVATYPPANPEAANFAELLASFHAGHGEGGFQPGADPVVFKDWAVALGLEEEKTP